MHWHTLKFVEIMSLSYAYINDMTLETLGGLFNNTQITLRITRM